jgi:hypothetical protein
MRKKSRYISFLYSKGYRLYDIQNCGFLWRHREMFRKYQKLEFIAISNDLIAVRDFYGKTADKDYFDSFETGDEERTSKVLPTV